MNTRQETVKTTVRQRICKDCAHLFYAVEIVLPYEAVRWENKSMQRVDGFRTIQFS
jgi:hypothetical protein